MARARKGSPVGRFSRLLRRRSGTRTDSEFRRLEEKYRTASAATQQWLSLLREMERNGETNESRYEQYFERILAGEAA